jgi:hypothetical protein
VGRDPRAARCGRAETERRSCRPLRTVTPAPTRLTADAGTRLTTEPGQPPSQHGPGSGTSCGFRGCPDAPPLRSGLSSNSSSRLMARRGPNADVVVAAGRRDPASTLRVRATVVPGDRSEDLTRPDKDRQSRFVHTGIAMPDRLRRSADPSTVHGPPVRRVPGPI